MKAFICNRTLDKDAVGDVIDQLFKESENSLAILRETEHSETWKTGVEKKMQECDFVLFVLGDATFSSDQIGDSG